MFAIERIRIIKNYLIKDNKVSVAKLSELLNVTEVTIRRDLEKLEKEGFLKRTHGGAVLHTPSDEFMADEALDETSLPYNEIADTAYHIIEDSCSVMLTSGPINVLLSKLLTSKSNLTVVTNDLDIASSLSSSKENSIICLGGDLEDRALYGQMTSDNLRNFSFDHAFIEVDGFTPSMGFSVSSMKKATLVQQVAKLADSVTIICPSSNFGFNSLYRAGKPSIAHRVLTDSNVNDDFKKLLFDQNIPVFTSINLYED